MKNNIRYNSAGYNDPTAFQALRNIIREEKLAKKSKRQKTKRRTKPLVFICSSYTGDINTNAKKSRAYCKFAVKRNMIPIAPHLLFLPFLHLDNVVDRKLRESICWLLFEICSELWVFNLDHTYFMKSMIESAKEKRMPVKCFIEVDKEVKS